MKVAGCKKCCDLISSHDEKAVDLWIRMCMTSAKSGHGVMLLKEQNIPEFLPQIRLLEKLGFTISADGAEAVRFKVLGHQTVFDEEQGELETYCIDREGHIYEQT